VRPTHGAMTHLSCDVAGLGAGSLRTTTSMQRGMLPALAFACTRTRWKSQKKELSTCQHSGGRDLAPQMPQKRIEVHVEILWTTATESQLFVHVAWP
jgi:hypothetical protein